MINNMTLSPSSTHLATLLMLMIASLSLPFNNDDSSKYFALAFSPISIPRVVPSSSTPLTFLPQVKGATNYAFDDTSNLNNNFILSRCTTLFAKNNSRKQTSKQQNTSSKPQPQPAQFEYQELRAQFTTMYNQNIRPNMLSSEKRSELQAYLTKLILNRPSPTSLKSIADNNAKALYGNWSLVYSTEYATLGDLPRDATIQLDIQPDYKCEYKLTFANTLGLKAITAKSTYIVDSSPVNPGLVTFIYQDIVTDVFGFKNFPVGTFGLLKGRANYVESIWFDGMLWIERGYSPEGKEYLNVYMKSNDEE
mmetsp:Transcript_15467/g.17985  ORF Transcript_15467/g.17985 Transcript_15467/m.17985 type:complete len:308 (+) Transcript_15467:117-1040(+)